MSIYWDDKENAAMQCADNWKSFGSFCWYSEPENNNKYMHYSLSHRDSDLLTQSNHDAIIAALGEIDSDNDFHWVECHSHWAVDYSNVLILQVYEDDNKTITSAFSEFCDIMQALEDYPVLDDDDYSERVYNQNYEHITDVLQNMIAIDDDDDLQTLVSHIFATMGNSGFYDNEDLYLYNDDILKIVSKNNLPLQPGSWVALYDDYNDLYMIKVKKIVQKDTLFDNFKIVTLHLDDDTIVTIDYNINDTQLNDHIIVLYNEEEKQI